MTGISFWPPGQDGHCAQRQFVASQAVDGARGGVGQAALNAAFAAGTWTASRLQVTASRFGFPQSHDLTPGAPRLERRAFGADFLPCSISSRARGEESLWLRRLVRWRQGHLSRFVRRPLRHTGTA